MRTIILACCVAMALSACNDSRQSATASPVQPATTQAPDPQPAPVSAPVATIEPTLAPAPEPTHNYAMEQDGEYGYQPGISEDEAKQGTVAKPLAMYRYRGKLSGVYTVDIVDDDGVTYRASCQEPCEFVKIRAILNGQTLKTSTMANTSGSLINAVLEDAMNGQLKPYTR